MDPMGLTLQAPQSAALLADVAEVFDLVNAELILQETGGTLTADGTEQTVYINDDPQGVHRPVVVKIDLDNMAGGDTTNIRVYYRLLDGGGLQSQDYNQYVGADGALANGRKLIAVELLPNRFGARVTLEQTGGVNRDYVWAYFEEA